MSCRWITKKCNAGIRAAGRRGEIHCRAPADCCVLSSAYVKSDASAGGIGTALDREVSVDEVEAWLKGSRRIIPTYG